MGLQYQAFETWEKSKQAYKGWGSEELIKINAYPPPLPPPPPPFNYSTDN